MSALTGQWLRLDKLVWPSTTVKYSLLSYLFSGDCWSPSFTSEAVLLAAYVSSGSGRFNTRSADFDGWVLLGDRVTAGKGCELVMNRSRGTVTDGWSYLSCWDDWGRLTTTTMSLPADFKTSTARRWLASTRLCPFTWNIRASSHYKQQTSDTQQVYHSYKVQHNIAQLAPTKLCPFTWTRGSAIAQEPRDALRQLKYYGRFLTELLTKSSANSEELCEHNVSWNRVKCCTNVRRIACENVCNQWMTFTDIQGHCCCHHLIGHILFPISLPL